MVPVPDIKWKARGRARNARHISFLSQLSFAFVFGLSRPHLLGPSFILSLKPLLKTENHRMLMKKKKNTQWRSLFIRILVCDFFRILLPNFIGMRVVSVANFFLQNIVHFLCKCHVKFYNYILKFLKKYSLLHRLQKGHVFRTI